MDTEPLPWMSDAACPRLAGAAVTSVSQRTRDRIIRRDLGMCQRCGNTADTVPLHRRPLGVFPENLILMCGTEATGCRRWVRRNPMKARTNGWDVSINTTNYGPEDVPALGRDAHGIKQRFYFDGFDRVPVPRDTAVMRLVALGIRKDGM